jgi:hypothetical protein
MLNLVFETSVVQDLLPPARPVMPRILAFAGFKFSGKSTATKILAQEIPGCVVFAFADRLKQTAQVMFDLEPQYLWGAEKDVPIPRLGNKTGRDLVIWLGQKARNELGIEFPEVGGLWVHHFHNLVLREKAPILVEDCRFPDEVAAIRKYGGKIVVIEAPGDAKKREEEKPVDVSEDVAAVIRAAGPDVLFVSNPKNNLQEFQRNLEMVFKERL